MRFVAWNFSATGAVCIHFGLRADGATLSAIVLRKIWNDPVWSKVIAAAIIAGFGWLTYRLNWWPGWMTRGIATVWAYLLSPLSISHWLFGLLIFLLALSVLTIVFLTAVLKSETAPKWIYYRTDLFDRLRWRWRYQGSDIDIHSLVPFCPICDLQVVPIIGPSFVNKVRFECEKCHQELGTHEGSLDSLQNKVIRLIHQKIRTQTWPEHPA